MGEWVGGSFDPEAFDVGALNRAFHGGSYLPEDQRMRRGARRLFRARPPCGSSASPVAADSGFDRNPRARCRHGRRSARSPDLRHLATIDSAGCSESARSRAG